MIVSVCVCVCVCVGVCVSASLLICEDTMLIAHQTWEDLFRYEDLHTGPHNEKLLTYCKRHVKHVSKISPKSSQQR